MEERGISCHVLDAASIEVNRRRRRPKTDRLDATELVRVLMTWHRGERHVCSMLRVPSRDEEDLRRSHRERRRLVAEQIAHVDRIKACCSPTAFASSVVAAIVESSTVSSPAMVVRSQPRLKAEVAHEVARLAQIAEVETERDLAPTPCADSEAKRLRLLKLRHRAGRGGYSGTRDLSLV